MFDTPEQILIAKTYACMGKYFEQAITNNGEAEILLNCSGLSELYTKYNSILEPYSYNANWRNPDTQFNPEHAFFSICKDIEGNNEVLGRFLKCFFEKITKIEDNDFEYISKNLNVIGYELTITSVPAPRFHNRLVKTQYELTSITKGSLERSEDVSHLLKQLHNLEPQLSKTYKAAIETYLDGDYKNCVTSCRSLLEEVLTAKHPGDKYCAILHLTKEQVVDENNNILTTRNKIFNQWIKDPTCKGDRFRLIAMLYSFLSGLGTHATPAGTDKKDALWALRTTEDVLIWIMS